MSYGYSLRGGWLPSYRETSGYILTTLLRAAEVLEQPVLRQRALRIGEFLLDVQNPDGSFSNPAYGEDGIVFDTGQALFGLLGAFDATKDEQWLAAARRSAEWLATVADHHGLWTRFEHKNTPHVYNTRTAWAITEYLKHESNDHAESIARANLDWAVSNQTASGFFENNAFVAGDAPYSHNISYAICGLQESGWLLQTSEYVDAARRCADAARSLMGADGFLPGQITATGSPAATYSCLTGQAQLAVVWARQANPYGASPASDSTELMAASRTSLEFVMRHHRRSGGREATRGAVAGSAPIWGRYAPMSYPNWATKFFADACLLHLGKEVPTGG